LALSSEVCFFISITCLCNLKVFRYLAAVIGGTRSPNWKGIIADIANALLVSRAENGTPAVYRNRDEQVQLMDAMYNKWDQKGAWAVAGPMVN
jgi:hypothetical protein